MQLGDSEVEFPERESKVPWELPPSNLSSQCEEPPSVCTSSEEVVSAVDRVPEAAKVVQEDAKSVLFSLVKDMVSVVVINRV